MAPVAILSDIHSNLEALDAVLARAKELGADRTYVLGDIVGYGADPVAVVDRLTDIGAVCIAGNHDLATMERFDLDWFNRIAADAVRWTRAQLDDGARAILAALEPKRVQDGTLLVHGSPREPASEYLTNVVDAVASFELFDQNLCFFGHTHIPGAFVQSEKRVIAMGATDGEDLAIAGGSRFMINPGSVGQPRDGDPRASFAMTDGARVVWNRVSYDVDRAAAKIRDAGLPERLASRLAEGR